MARKQREEPNSQEWLNTYADMVTLLLTFFVMLFAMSSVDAEKFQILVKAFTKSGNETSQIVMIPEGDGEDIAENAGSDALASEDSIDSQNNLPENFDQLYEYIKSFVSENDLSAQVDVEKGEDQVYIRFNDSILFDANKAVLKTVSIDLLSYVGDCFNNVDAEIATIIINGHTAAVPNAENYGVSDRILSTDRANSVLMYLEDTKLCSSPKLFAIGHGKNYPIATNDTAEGRSKNRRVDITVSSKAKELSGADIFGKLFNPNAPVDDNAVNIPISEMLPKETVPIEIQASSPASDTPSDSQ